MGTSADIKAEDYRKHRKLGAYLKSATLTSDNLPSFWKMFINNVQAGMMV